LSAMAAAASHGHNWLSRPATIQHRPVDPGDDVAPVLQRVVEQQPDRLGGGGVAECRWPARSASWANPAPTSLPPCRLRSVRRPRRTRCRRWQGCSRRTRAASRGCSASSASGRRSRRRGVGRC
jgi:hypothetical protein